MKRQILVKEKGHLVKKYWENFRQTYLDAKKVKSQIVIAIKQYNETLVVQAFVSLKAHATDHKIKKVELMKANQSYSLLLLRKYFAKLQQYCATQKSLNLNRFEFTKRISQVNETILKERSFRSWKNYCSNKQKIMKIKTVFVDKKTEKIRKEYLQKWIQVSHKIISKTQNLVNEKEKEIFNMTQKRHLLAVFNAWKSVVCGNLRRLRREKVHSVFIAWKMQTKERCLLQQYLKQCNIDEKYSHTPISSYRYEAPKLQKDYMIGPIVSPESTEDNCTGRIPANNVTFYSPLTVNENSEVNKQPAKE